MCRSRYAMPVRSSVFVVGLGVGVVAAGQCETAGATSRPLRPIGAALACATLKFPRSRTFWRSSFPTTLALLFVSRSLEQATAHTSHLTAHTMESSRIFVRGLPPKFTEDDVRKHFAKFPVTDVKFFPHRRIGYVGYKTPEDAAKAVKYFNKTFIRMTKINVEIARPVSPSISLTPPLGTDTLTDCRRAAPQVTAPDQSREGCTEERRLLPAAEEGERAQAEARGGRARPQIEGIPRDLPAAFEDEHLDRRRCTNCCWQLYYCRGARARCRRACRRER